LSALDTTVALAVTLALATNIAPPTNVENADCENELNPNIIQLQDQFQELLLEQVLV